MITATSGRDDAGAGRRGDGMTGGRDDAGTGGRGEPEDLVLIRFFVFVVISILPVPVSPFLRLHCGFAAQPVR